MEEIKEEKYAQMNDNQYELLEISSVRNIKNTRSY